MKDEELFAEMDYPDFLSWAEAQGISRSVAYDLVSIEQSLHREQLAELPISKARLLLPHAGNGATPEHVAELASQIKDLSWHDARQMLQGEDRVFPYVDVTCPACRRWIKASRAVDLRIP